MNLVPIESTCVLAMPAKTAEVLKWRILPAWLEANEISPTGSGNHTTGLGSDVGADFCNDMHYFVD
jgi:hypothetical protein